MKLNRCCDLAYEPDCRVKASLGFCNTYLSNGLTFSSYCPKSCNICPKNSYLSCNQVNCNGGHCVPVSYFGISSIQCNCPNTRGGTYCHLINPCLHNPCLNGGKCTPNYSNHFPTHTCTCSFGYQGKNCEIFRNPCSNLQCYNGGTCIIDRFNQPRCLCLQSFSGQFCENCNLKYS